MAVFLEGDQHHMEAPRCKCNGFARLDFEATLDRSHFHNTAFHCHAVYLALRAGVARHAIHPIRCRALVRDRHVARAGLGSFRRSASPWLSDVDRADIIIGGLRSNSDASERQSCREKIGDERRRWPYFGEQFGHVFPHLGECVCAMSPRRGVYLRMWVCIPTLLAAFSKNDFHVLYRKTIRNCFRA
jgi:hypothetical protein